MFLQMVWQKKVATLHVIPVKQPLTIVSKYYPNISQQQPKGELNYPWENIPKCIGNPLQKTPWSAVLPEGS
jgi:hypothetical protein